MSEIKLSQKHKDFLRHKAKVEVLEGTTYAGKTTVGVVKFMLHVADSDEKHHILAGLDLGTIEKNIINSDNGIADIFGRFIRIRLSGYGDIKLPHIMYKPRSGQQKIIYILGYDNKARWKKALGGQYGCVYVDEANIADIDFIRELSIRNDYMLMTLNPDNPDLPIYSEYINKARPLKKWIEDIPAELLEQLNAEHNPAWTHWYFSFKDNLAMSAEKLSQLLGSTPKGTKLYKNKILGLRGRETGLVFNLEQQNVITAEEAKEYNYSFFTCGVDTSYSSKTGDTIAFKFGGITNEGKYISLCELVRNNRDLSNPLSPSDVAPLLTEFLEQCRARYGMAKAVFIDSADSATILECQKYKQLNGTIYTFAPAHKKTKILDRITLQRGWLAKGDFLIVDECKEGIKELNTYSWREDKYDQPEDGNDHTINAEQYAWLPYKDKIGVNKNGGKPLRY